MAEDMLVDPGSKRDREIECMETFRRMKRSHSVDTYFFRHYILSPTEMFYSADFHDNPPNIDQFLELNLHEKKKEILHHADKIKTLVELEQWDEIEKHAKELSEIFSIDPRLIGELDEDLLQLMLDFLCCQQHPKLESPAIIIIQHYFSNTNYGNKRFYAHDIAASVIKHLLSSKDIDLKMQALCLFRTIAPAEPHTYIVALHEVLETITLVINDSSVDEELLCGVSMTLAIVCQDYFMYPLQKKPVLDAFKKLFECNRVDLLTYACMGLVYLCEGRESIEFVKNYLVDFVHQLIEIIWCFYQPKNRPSTIAALAAFGAIVRWGSDYDIEVIIEGSTALPLLQELLHIPDKQYVGNACRIISNITAGKENHIRAVVEFGLIDDLFHVLQNYKLIDVKKEAAWAILNAIYVVGSDWIEDFRNSCIKPLWDILKVFRADQEIISFCLEGLVYSEEVKIIYNGKPINALELKKHLGTLRGGQSKSELKKPRYDMDNKRSEDSFSFRYDTDNERFEDGMEFSVTHTVKESTRLPDLEIRLLYKSSEEDSSNIVDQMEVDEPEENLYIRF